jgi:DNA repair protein SbcD/Mre11
VISSSPQIRPRRPPGPMPKFAHMSDIHIGAFRQPELRKLVLDAFESAIDRCIDEKVAFVIMAGDIFDSNVPDLSAVRRAAAKIREASDSGIRFYAIYGSHDFSPNYSSIVDVLDGAGLFTKVEDIGSTEGGISLDFTQDPSGPKICGISGRKLSLDADIYASLDKAALEAEPGFKVFVFHGGIEELKPKSLEMMKAMPASNLPEGFQYYAGGHLHNRSVDRLPGREYISYPGPLFATDYSELLQIAHGERRGFYLVDFDTRVVGVEFVPVKVCDVVEVNYSAEGKSPAEVEAGLARRAQSTDLAGKVVLLTIEGKLREGRTSDVDLAAVKKRFLSSKPLIVLPNYSRLSSVDMAAQAGPTKPSYEIERETFGKNIAGLKYGDQALVGDRGVELAMGLLTALKEGKKENENRGDFEDRTTKSGFSVLGLKEEE